MKKIVIVAIVISILIIITSISSFIIVSNVNNELNREKNSPVSNGASFEYSFGAQYTYKSFLSDKTKYANEIVNSSGVVNGFLYINVTKNTAYFHAFTYNCTHSILTNEYFSRSIESNIFKSFFPYGNHLNTGDTIMFGNNLIIIKNQATQCVASHYKLYYGNKNIEYVPYNAKVTHVSDICSIWNYSIFFSAMYIQSNHYSMLDGFSVSGNSTIAALLLGNVGVIKSWFTISLDKTNVKITAINYDIYIRNYVPFFILIWIVGIAYLISLRARGKKWIK